MGNAISVVVLLIDDTPFDHTFETWLSNISLSTSPHDAERFPPSCGVAKRVDGTQSRSRFSTTPAFIHGQSSYTSSRQEAAPSIDQIPRIANLNNEANHHANNSQTCRAPMRGEQSSMKSSHAAILLSRRESLSATLGKRDEVGIQVSYSPAC